MCEAQSQNEPPTCSLAHRFLNKLAIIVGNCELLQERAELDAPNSECWRRLAMIRRAASEMAEDIKDHGCGFDNVSGTGTHYDPMVAVLSTSLDTPPCGAALPQGTGPHGGHSRK
jgi:hypothetical protein